MIADTLETESSTEESRKEAERRFHNERFGNEHDIREPLNKWYKAVEGCLRLQLDSVMKYGKDATILEYGCGDGRFSLRETGIAGNAAHFYGIDISDKAIDKARETAASQGFRHCEFAVMDAERLTFPDGMFDVVFGQGIIHHLDLDKSFNEIARVLRPGGIALFGEPLGHNPALNRFRRNTPHLRTHDEHPLVMKDIRFAQTVFRKVDKKFFGMTTLGAIPFQKTPLGPGLMKLCEGIDSLILRLPFIQKHAWFVHLTLTK